MGGGGGGPAGSQWKTSNVKAEVEMLKKQHHSWWFSCTHLWFVGASEKLGIRDGVVEIGPEEVGPQSFGRLVGHLDATLQDGHREDLRRITGQPQAETRLGLRRVRDHLEEGWTRLLTGGLFIPKCMLSLLILSFGRR